MTPNPIMTRGYELDSFGMPKPTPAPVDEEAGPFCDGCGVEITSGTLVMRCPKGKDCALCDDFEAVERCRIDFGIERFKPVWTDSMMQFWGRK